MRIDQTWHNKAPTGIDTSRLGGDWTCGAPNFANRAILDHQGAPFLQLGAPAIKNRAIL